MSTKMGLVTLIVGGYLLAIGLAGVNEAESAGIRWLFALMIIAGTVVAGWSVLLPWDDSKHGRAAPEPGPNPTHRGAA